MPAIVCCQPGPAAMDTPLEIEASALATRPRLAAFAIWDNLTRPAARDARDVPWHGEAVSAEWITAVVGIHVPGAKALDVRVLGGNDGSSARRIIAIEWNEPGSAAHLPRTLFTKSTPTLPMRLSAGKAAPAEGHFLMHLKPAVPIEAPYCLSSMRDGRTGRSIHLMEDLTATKGARFCDATSSIDRAQVTQIVDTLATLHGTFLAPAPAADPAALRTYEDFFHAAARNGIEAGHDAAMKKAAHVIPPRVVAQGARIWPLAVEALRMHEQSPRTVIHSDVHLGNWYVTAGGRMGLCDWARVCPGHWGRDLAYELMTTISVDDRRAWERSLIAHYVDRMREISGAEIDFATAWNGYRRQAFAALLMWTPTLCPPPTLPDMQPESTSMLMIERITTAIDDLDALALS